MKSTVVFVLAIVTATVTVAVVNSSAGNNLTACVSTKSGSNDGYSCLNGVGCYASLNYLITELSNCTYVTAIPDKVIIRVESDIELNDTLFITNFCNISKGFELIGSDMYPTVKCHGFGMGFHFRDIQDLHIAHLKFSKCGFSQFYDEVSDSVEFEFHAALHLVQCNNVVINNVTISNSQGVGAIFQNTHGEVTIVNSTFEKNEPVSQSSGGGGLYIELGSHNTDHNASQIESRYYVGKYIIQNCFFIRNSAIFNALQFLSNSSFDISSKSLLGKGGGLFISLHDNNNRHQVKVLNCTFDENTALGGGGVFVQLWESPNNNTVIIESSLFLKNKCRHAGGGANIGYAFCADPKNGAYNNITFLDCLFEDNISQGSGGGVYLFSTQATDLSIITNTITFHNCTLKRNQAYIASALALVPKTHHNGSLPIPVLSWCNFLSNYVINKTLVNSDVFNASLNGLATIIVSDFQIKFEGNTHFFENTGTALWLTSAQVEIVYGALLNFTNNSGSYGGAIGLYGESVIHICNKTRLYFINNTAKLRGGAISVETSDFLQKYLFSHNCFIQYKGNPTKGDNDVVFHFDGNKALSGNGDIFFAASVHSCLQTSNRGDPLQLQIFESIGTVISPQTPPIHLNNNTVRTLPNNFSLSSETTVEVQPDISFDLNLTAIDEFSQPTMMIYQAYVEDMNKFDDISTDPAYVYTSDSEKNVTVNGIKAMTGDSTTLILESERATLQIKILLVDCPPGFVNDDSGTCKCGAAYFNGISSCVSYQAHIVQGYWAGRCKDNQFCTAYCAAGFCNYREYRTMSSSDLLLLPRDIKHLDSFVCGPARTGILCGKCSLHYSTHYHSYYYGCKSNKLCKFGILFFLISELLPLTVIYTIVMVFNISFTSGEISGFIFFAQIADSLSISASDTIRFPTAIWYFTQAHQLIYRMFNFDFFSIEALSFCLWEGATALDALIMKYVTIVYAMGLIVVTILLMKSTRLKRFFMCLRPRALRSAAIHGLTTFIIICYSQCARVTFQIISPAHLYGHGPEIIDTVVQRSGELKPFDKTHRKYAIPALFFFFVLVVLPLLWLLLYPFLFKLLERFKLSESKFAAFLSKLFPMELLDSFQSCFKPNRRYFAGLYFLYRIMSLLAYSASSTLAEFYTLLTLGMILVITLHSIAQPYKILWHNILDAFIFANIMAVNALTLYNFHILGVGNDNSSRSVNIALSVQLVLMYLPLVYIVMLVARKIYVKVKRRYPRLSMDCNALNFDDSTELPSLRDSISYYDYSD